jgi:hypothetical protein
LFKDRSYKLPEEFTIEFDVFLDGKEGETSVELMNANADVTASTMFWIDNTRILSHWVGSAGEQNSEEPSTTVRGGTILHFRSTNGQ